jgi:hypothetical protein
MTLHDGFPVLQEIFPVVILLMQTCLTRVMTFCSLLPFSAIVHNEYKSIQYQVVSHYKYVSVQERTKYLNMW